MVKFIYKNTVMLAKGFVLLRYRLLCNEFIFYTLNGNIGFK